MKWAEMALEVGVVEVNVEVVLRVVVLTAAGGLLAHHEPSGEGEEVKRVLRCIVRLCYVTAFVY